MKCDELIPTQIYAQFAEAVYDDFGDSRQEQEMKVKEVKNSDTFDLNVEGLKAERQELVSIAKGLKNKKEADK